MEALVRALRDVIKQSRRRDAERSRELDDGAEPWLSGSSLEAGDLGGVQIAGVAEGFLRQADALAFTTDVATKDLRRRLHAVDPLLAQPKALEPKPQSLGSLPRLQTLIREVERRVAMKPVLLAGMVVGVVLASAAPAAASQNASPSTAVEVMPGVPFSGSWPSTPMAQTGCCDYWHWYRPSVTLRTGDVVQLAVDNTQGPGISLCFASPTDEFGAAEVLRRECPNVVYDDDSTPGGQRRRVRLVYQRSKSGGMLLVGSYTPDDVTQTGAYTITIERIITRINVGLLPSTQVRRSFSLTAVLRYGDNTPAADGSAATLQYRRGRRTSSGSERFTTIARGTATAGSVRFAVRLPRRVGPRLQLRACADQPGGTTPRCTRVYGVRVA